MKLLIEISEEIYLGCKKKKLLVSAVERLVNAVVEGAVLSEDCKIAVSADDLLKAARRDD